MGYRLTPPAGTLGPDYLRSGHVPPAHGSSHSQLTAAELRLVENQAAGVCLNSSYRLPLLLQSTLIYQLFLTLQSVLYRLCHKQTF